MNDVFNNGRSSNDGGQYDDEGAHDDKPYDDEPYDLSRECLRLRCLPEPSFADMSYVAATCRRHVFAHVADTATLHVG